MASPWVLAYMEVKDPEFDCPIYIIKLRESVDLWDYGAFFPLSHKPAMPIAIGFGSVWQFVSWNPPCFVPYPPQRPCMTDMCSNISWWGPLYFIQHNGHA